MLWQCSRRSEAQMLLLVPCVFFTCWCDSLLLRIPVKLQLLPRAKTAGAVPFAVLLQLEALLVEEAEPPKGSFNCFSVGDAPPCGSSSSALAWIRPVSVRRAFRMSRREILSQTKQHPSSTSFV